MCIYERVALLGIGIAALIALIDPTRFWLRWLALLLWGFSALRGLQLSLRHVDIQLNPSPFNTCSPFTEFPSFLPLDQWVPWMFTATPEIAPRSSGPSSAGRCPSGWCADLRSLYRHLSGDHDWQSGQGPLLPVTIV